MSQVRSVGKTGGRAEIFYLKYSKMACPAVVKLGLFVSLCKATLFFEVSILIAGLKALNTQVQFVETLHCVVVGCVLMLSQACE